MRSSGITVYTETSSSFIPFILHEEIQGILPVLILHTEGKEIFYPVYKDLQDIPDIPVIHDIPALQALLHVPAPSSTIQYLPVLSSVSKDSTRSSISSIRMQILHTDWFSTRNSIECQSNTRQYILQAFHSSKKGRCCNMSQYDTIGKIELIPTFVLSTDNTNCCNDIHKFS